MKSKPFNTSDFKKFTELLEFPLYLRIKTSTGSIIDKLETVKNKSYFDRYRYIVTGENQCSCLGWMKTKDCKHLKMIRNDFSWVGDSPVSFAKEKTRLVVQYLADQLNNESSARLLNFNESWLVSEDMDYVQSVDLNLSKVGATVPKDFTQLVSIFKSPDTDYKFALNLNFDLKED